MSPIANDLDHIRRMAEDAGLAERVRELWLDFLRYRYAYNFSWLGRPIIQVPEDIVAIQELIWKVEPELIIETGVAHGGGLILNASVLHCLESKGQVLGIDIDIRDHNRAAIEAHPMSSRITLIQGSSIDPMVVKQVHEFAAGKSPVMVILDSNHTHAHVLAELQAYSPLVGKGSYVVVLDTAIEDLPDGHYPDRPWTKTDNPKTAVREFLKENDRFRVDKSLEDRLLMSIAPEGYLACVGDPE